LSQQEANTSKLSKESPTSADEVQRLLAAIAALQMEVNKGDAMLSRGESIVCNEPSVMAHIHHRLQTLRRPYDELKSRIASLHSAVEGSLSLEQAFGTKLNNLLREIDVKTGELNRMAPISAHDHTLRKQAEEFEVMGGTHLS
jgi:chromosome segregation ATPase